MCLFSFLFIDFFVFFPKLKIVLVFFTLGKTACQQNLEHADSIPRKGSNTPTKIKGCPKYDTKLYLMCDSSSGALMKVEFLFNPMTHRFTLIQSDSTC